MGPIEAFKKKNQKQSASSGVVDCIIIVSFVGKSQDPSRLHTVNVLEVKSDASWLSPAWQKK